MTLQRGYINSHSAIERTLVLLSLIEHTHATDEGNHVDFRNRSCKMNSSSQNFMATQDDDSVAAILAEMRDSQAPAPISPVRSPYKQTWLESEEDIPSHQPAPKSLSTAESFSVLRNRIVSIETRRVKTKKSLSVLRKFASEHSCPIGLQYRPKPHVRPDSEFTAAMKQKFLLSQK